MAYGFNADKSKATLSNGSWTFLEETNEITYQSFIEVSGQAYYEAYQELIVMINEYVSTLPHDNYSISASTRFDTDQIYKSSADTGKIQEFTIPRAASSTGTFRVWFGNNGVMRIYNNDSTTQYVKKAVIYGVNPKT